MNKLPVSVSWLSNIPLLLVLLAWFALTYWALERYQPPQAIPASNTSEFSAERAYEHLKELVGNNKPHPTSSKENERIANWISEHLTKLGYLVESQTSIGIVEDAVRNRSSGRSEVPLENIIASFDLAPSMDAKKLLVVAHYDSVPFGPGASDNGVGVSAALEVASMLADSNLQREIVFLFTDGEELGLLGAKAFAQSHELIDEIGLVINLDARGSSGPSLMFETGQRSAKVVPAIARSMRRPFASSLFYEVYKRLPRDTDFTVFKKRDIEGMNFAFIGNVKNYHTENDTLANVSLNTLQHHGENVWALLNELEAPQYDSLFEKLETEWPQAPADATIPEEFSIRSWMGDSDRAVFFDIMGYRLFWWPEPVSMQLAILVVVCWFAVVGVRIFRRNLSKDEETPIAQNDSIFTVTGYFADGLRLVVYMSLAFGGTWGILRLMKLNEKFALAWPEPALLLHLGFWFAAIALLIGVSIWLHPNSGPMRDGILKTNRFMHVHLGMVAALSVLTTIYVTGGSYLVLIPCAVAIGSHCLFLFWRGLPSSVWANGLLGFVAAAAIGGMWLPLEALFFDAVGFQMPLVNAFRVAFVSVAITPVVAMSTHRFRFFTSMVLVVASVALFAIAELQ